jgi:hypothetical protein
VYALLQTWQEAAAEQKGVDSSLLHDQQVLALAQQLRQEVAQQAAKNHKKGEALLHPLAQELLLCNVQHLAAVFVRIVQCMWSVCPAVLCSAGGYICRKAGCMPDRIWA